MTLRELVFMVLDECKIHSDDSYFNEDHVSFLLSKYRSFLLKKELEKENKSLSSANAQTICLDLMEVPAIEDFDCSGSYLRSTEKIPSIVNEFKVQLYPLDYYQGEIIFTSRERMRYTGYNKWTKNFIYASKGPDDYLYLKSENPQYLYMKKLRMTAIFEDFEEAAQLACDEDGVAVCDKLDAQFPIESAQVPIIIELVVKELLGVEYQPKDKNNNAADDASMHIAATQAS